MQFIQFRCHRALVCALLCVFAQAFSIPRCHLRLLRCFFTSQQDDAVQFLPPQLSTCQGATIGRLLVLFDRFFGRIAVEQPLVTSRLECLCCQQLLRGPQNHQLVLRSLSLSLDRGSATLI